MEEKTISKHDLIVNFKKKFIYKQQNISLNKGNDALSVNCKNNNILFASSLFIENIHFDLTYFPLKYLGYKCVSVTCSNILAMNAVPSFIKISLAVSNRFGKEALEELTIGIADCCENYKIELADFDINSSSTGLIISMEAYGIAGSNSIVDRKGASEKELICLSGDLCSAYTGLLLLEREKLAFKANPNEQPDFEGFDHILKKQLKPEPRLDIINALSKEKIIPTSMICVKDGLAAALINLCRASEKGCIIYENKLPVETVTFNTLRDFKIVATTVALNGGEDFELLFTIKLSDFEKLEKLDDISVIGYVVDKSGGTRIITNDERIIDLTAQEFVN